jgi:hypothetical protein
MDRTSAGTLVSARDRGRCRGPGMAVVDADQAGTRFGAPIIPDDESAGVARFACLSAGRPQGRADHAKRSRPATNPSGLNLLRQRNIG